MTDWSKFAKPDTDWSEFATATKPAENFLDERHPDIGIWDRWLTKNLASHAGAQRYYESKGFEAKGNEGRTYYRKPGETDWRVDDPSSVDWQDFFDVSGDVGDIVGSIGGGVGGGTAGAAATGGVGAVGGAMLGAAGGQAAVQTGRHALGNLLGIPLGGVEGQVDDLTETGINSAIAGVGEGVGIAANKFVISPLMKKWAASRAARGSNEILGDLRRAESSRAGDIDQVVREGEATEAARMADHRPASQIRPEIEQSVWRKYNKSQSAIEEALEAKKAEGLGQRATYEIESDIDLANSAPERGARVQQQGVNSEVQKRIIQKIEEQTLASEGLDQVPQSAIDKLKTGEDFTSQEWRESMPGIMKSVPEQQPVKLSWIKHKTDAAAAKGLEEELISKDVLGTYPAGLQTELPESFRSTTENLITPAELLEEFHRLNKAKHTEFRDTPKYFEKLSPPEQREYLTEELWKLKNPGALTRSMSDRTRTVTRGVKIADRDEYFKEYADTSIEDLKEIINTARVDRGLKGKVRNGPKWDDDTPNEVKRQYFIKHLFRVENTNTAKLFKGSMDLRGGRDTQAHEFPIWDLAGRGPIHTVPENITEATIGGRDTREFLAEALERQAGRGRDIEALEASKKSIDEFLPQQPGVDEGRVSELTSELAKVKAIKARILELETEMARPMGHPAQGMKPGTVRTPDFTAEDAEISRLTDELNSFPEASPRIIKSPDTSFDDARISGLQGEYDQSRIPSTGEKIWGALGAGSDDIAENRAAGLFAGAPQDAPGRGFANKAFGQAGRAVEGFGNAMGYPGRAMDRGIDKVFRAMKSEGALGGGGILGRGMLFGTGALGGGFGIPGKAYLGAQVARGIGSGISSVGRFISRNPVAWARKQLANISGNPKLQQLAQKLLEISETRGHNAVKATIWMALRDPELRQAFLGEAGELGLASDRTETQ